MQFAKSMIITQETYHDVHMPLNKYSCWYLKRMPARARFVFSKHALGRCMSQAHSITTDASAQHFQNGLGPSLGQLSAVVSRVLKACVHAERS